MLICHQPIFFPELSFQIVSHLKKISLVVYFIIEFGKYCICSGYKSFINCMLGKYILVCGLPFHSLKNVF